MEMSAGAVGIGGSDLLRFIRRGRSFSGHEENCAFLNTGGVRFADVSAVTGLNLDDDGRAIGVGIMTVTLTSGLLIETGLN